MDFLSVVVAGAVMYTVGVVMSSWVHEQTKTFWGLIATALWVGLILSVPVVPMADAAVTFVQGIIRVITEGN